MTIRTYLTLSYLLLIILMGLGMWFTAHRLADQLARDSLENAQRGVQRTISSTTRIAEEVLTTYGEALVDSRVAAMSRGLANRLQGRDLKHYAALRQDPDLRRIINLKIDTPEGQLGSFMVYDNQGEVLLFPRQDIEGRNARDWQPEYQELHALLQRSLTEDEVNGYYTYFDRTQNKERRRYTSRRHIPGTPFILGAQVNIDEFFVPAQQKITQAAMQIHGEAQKRIEKNAREVRRLILLFFLVGSALIALITIPSGLWLAAAISRPLERLDRGVQQVGEGDFAVAVPETGFKEVKDLAQSFNLLGAQLTDYIAKRDFIRDTFSRYVTKEVVKKLLESGDALKMGGEIREVSILMSDLRGFTALTATMAPEQVITLLNRFLGQMIEILLDNQAVIDEIVGDGILAFFGAPETQEDHPQRAVATALKLQQVMQEVNRLNQADGLPTLEMGVAVNTGQVVVGNIGSDRRAKYSVVGSHVNFASRIEAYALGGQVIISAATYERVKDLVEIGNVVEVEVKGMPGLVKLYEILGLGGGYDLHLAGRTESMVSLPEPLPVKIYRIEDKIITGAVGSAKILELSEIAARVVYEGELKPWEDVNVRLLGQAEAELPARLYGKVIAVRPAADAPQEATIRFTSLSPEAAETIKAVISKT
jgi:class 3 adenylate cyclase/HAMP domain-containing protein